MSRRSRFLFIALALLSLLWTAHAQDQQPNCATELGGMYLQAVKIQNQLTAANARNAQLEAEVKRLSPPVPAPEKK